MQHSPPLCVLQQQSTSATFHLSLIDASAAASGTQHRELSECLAQLDSALADEKVAKINTNAITVILTMELSGLLTPYTLVARNYVARARKKFGGGLAVGAGCRERSGLGIISFVGLQEVEWVI